MLRPYNSISMIMQQSSIDFKRVGWTVLKKQIIEEWEDIKQMIMVRMDSNMVIFSSDMKIKFATILLTK